jgi:hypothetical protein
MDKKSINLLSLIPNHNIEWEINKENNLIVIKKPKFLNPFLKKHLVPLMKRPDYFVKLDKIGSFFWQNIDGKMTIEEIADKMKKEFGQSIEPVYDRLGQFVNSLLKHHFINVSDR